jgi:hypothetical protein
MLNVGTAYATPTVPEGCPKLPGAPQMYKGMGYRVPALQVLNIDLIRKEKL